MVLKKKLKINGEYWYAKYNRDDDLFIMEFAVDLFNDLHGNTYKCFKIHVDPVYSDGVFDPVKTFENGVKQYFYQKKREEMRIKKINEFDSWDGVINYDC